MATTPFNIFDELREWAQTLEIWQQCALSKLVAQEQLSEDDLDLIFSEFLIGKGLVPPPETRNQYPINVPEGGGSDPSPAVKLKAIRGVGGVNALVAGQEISVGENLTIIFCPNASGKSGYARILKAACFTRPPHL